MLKYISSLANINSATYNSQLVMLYTVPHGLENASSQVMSNAGRNLFHATNKYLYENGNPSIYIYTINGIGNLDLEPYVVGYERAKSENRLSAFYDSRQGWDMWDTIVPDLCEVQRMWARVGITRGVRNIWQSNGRPICETNCAAPLNENDVSRVIASKSSFDSVRKIKIWTLTHERDLIFALNHGFDSIATSETRLVWQLINTEPYNQCYRMATWNDSPWSKVNPVAKCSVSRAGGGYGPTYGPQMNICGKPK
jgi:hypothetical protein